jgi:tetratricopeptide (TPR) repeat protein
MALAELKRQIGQGWHQHRLADEQGAIRIFEGVIDALAKLDQEGASVLLVDAYYGLGLSSRASGDTATASKAFKQALEICKQGLETLRSDKSNDLTTSEDDRYAMLSTMIRQRMREMGLEAN